MREQRKEVLDPEPQTRTQLDHEPLSLFDELFPEEKNQRQRQREAEETLERLPAFKWNSEIKVGPRAETERGKRRNSFHDIPRRREYMPLKEPNEGARGVKPAVLLLRAVSKNLEESDFFRLGPKGGHIEGWTTGITKGTNCVQLPSVHASHIQ